MFDTYLECSECGKSNEQAYLGDGFVECVVCGNVWKAFPDLHHHGISEQSWDYASQANDLAREG